VAQGNAVTAGEEASVQVSAVIHGPVSLGAIASLLALLVPPSAHSQPQFLRNGETGFVVSAFRYALADDAEKTGACPDGMSLNVEEIYAGTPQGKRRPGEPDERYAARLREGAEALSTAPEGENLCMNPEAGGPDPYFRSVRGADIAAEGIDLDGRDSHGADSPAPGTCAHDDLLGMNGGRGVDNQFFRVVGCIRSFQSTGLSNSFGTEMLTGSWGVLLTLSGVDDLRNDDSIEVGFYANADPIRLSPTRKPLAYGTYAMDQDPRFRAKAQGRIHDGVLTTEPVDLRLRHVVNSMRLERVLRDARLQATLSEEGVLQGYLAGYAPVEATYDLSFGFRNARDGAGELAPLKLRLGSSNGAARVLGYTCPGAYHALHTHADGHPDPDTGRCTSISTQYRIEAIPAFVVDAETRSSNVPLDKSPQGDD
jgi:hypothetical protein